MDCTFLLIFCLSLAKRYLGSIDNTAVSHAYFIAGIYHSSISQSCPSVTTAEDPEPSPTNVEFEYCYKPA